MIKVTEKIKLVHKIDLVCEIAILFIAHQEILVTNWEPTELFLYTFKPACRTTFESLWERLQSLLGTMLTTDVTILCLSTLDNDIFAYFLCYNYGLWN